MIFPPSISQCMGRWIEPYDRRAPSLKRGKLEINQESAKRHQSIEAPV